MIWAVERSGLPWPLASFWGGASNFPRGFGVMSDRNRGGVGLSTTKMSIIDIRGKTAMSNTVEDMQQAIIAKLSHKNVPFKNHLLERQGKPAAEVLLRSIPTMVLYSDKGLAIFDQITYNPEYYLTNAEINIFQKHSQEMVEYINDGDCLVELGAGSLRKTKFFLEAISKAGKKVSYYAVDLSESSLKEAIDPLVKMFPDIDFYGLWGTYNDSLSWIAANVPSSVRKMYLWLGSSIGNLTREEAHEFLGNVKKEAMQKGDLFLCGIDRRNSFKDVSLAYNDTQGQTRDFIMEGLVHVNAIMGKQIFDITKFEYVSIYNETLGRHEAYYKVLEQQTIDLPSKIVLEKDEMINVEYSYKYSQKEILEMMHKTRLHHAGKWTDDSDRYDLHLFQNPYFYLDRKRPQNIPSLEQFRSMWEAWDLITGSMIQPSRMLFKPIHLRHPYIFYLGHIPAFLDIQVARCQGEQFTSPQRFAEIFERGIDPDCEDPTKIHPHSEVPDQWPDLDQVMLYRDRVRERIEKLFDAPISNRLARVLFMCYEHEAMHLETLLYMLVQDPDHSKPMIADPILKDFSKTSLPENHLVQVKGGKVILGLKDSEKMDAIRLSPEFGWDNEIGQHTVQINDFSIQHRPVTVKEYLEFCEDKPDLVPSSWKQINSHYFVLTAFGPVPIEKAYHWPVYCSHDQAFAYAADKNMDLPTEAELKHLIQSHGPTESDNYGFAQMLPTPVKPFQSGITELVGNGWELTRTPFEPYPGYEQSELYPGYSSDFFDGKHYVVLGASWATAASIALRPSFRNWYQAKYPFVFSKFRLVQRA
ncbi:hypothetical protein EDD86DRAFT_201589 [Gorgonomyces haynaldii]|nr:hypothetical protein EDD86DRAFT_201589 [Gorgonomyces haynaldii]